MQKHTLLIAMAAGTVLFAAPPSPEARPKTATFNGMCDASAAAAIDAERFVVADDEDNVLRVYARHGGEPLFTFDVSEFIGNQGKKKPKEADLEAAAQVGPYTFWITSHGRNSKGKDQPERERFFATESKVQGDKVTIVPVGQPYLTLLDDMIAADSLKKYNLREASTKAPKSPGGLNIEGMSATPEGHVYIAFRSPVVDGKALVVPLENPKEVIKGQKARLGEPIELDLGGLGVRGIDFHHGRYVLIAGATGDGGQSQIFTWDGKSAPKPVEGVPLQGINPEGISFHSEAGDGEYFLLSDDGTRAVDGVECKSLKDPALKRFRGRVVAW